MFDKLIDLLIASLKLFQFFFVIDPYQEGLVLRLGRLHRPALCGFHWKWPFNVEQVLNCHVVLDSMVIGPQSLTTLDDQSIIVTSVLLYKVVDVKKFILEVGGLHVLESGSSGAIGQFVQAKSWAELKAMDDVDNELTKKVRVSARKCGVEVMSVQRTDMTRSRSIRLIQPKVA